MQLELWSLLKLFLECFRMNKQPLVSIIIVNWNGGEMFRKCLYSLEKINYKNYEIIIVDNNSTDESLEYARVFTTKVKIVHNKLNAGFAPANNQALPFCNGKYILLLNNDTKVGKDFLSIMVSKMESDMTIGVLQPKIYMMDQKEILDNAGSFFTKSGFLVHWGFGQKDSSEFDQETEVFTTKGACMLTRKDIVEEVGLFDDDFVSYFEETDFCWRVWLAGYRCVYYPKTAIEHKVGFTSSRLSPISVNTRSLSNRIVSLIKNLSVVNLFVVLPIHILILKGLFFYHLFKFELRKSKMYFDALFENVLNIGKTWSKRIKVQKLRKVTDKQIFEKVGRKFDIFEMLKHFAKVEKNFVTE